MYFLGHIWENLHYSANAIFTIQQIPTIQLFILQEVMRTIKSSKTIRTEICFLKVVKTTMQRFNLKCCKKYVNQTYLIIIIQNSILNSQDITTDMGLS